MTDPELLEYVREVAEQLLADLDQAAAATANFGHAGKAVQLVSEAMDRCLGSLAATGLIGEANQVPSGRLWQTAGEQLRRGELQHHAYSKPRGYAGDHEMLAKIWDRSICRDALGRCFDEFFQCQDAPEAVRARIRYAADTILQHAAQSDAAQSKASAYKIVSVGCGPAIEVALAAEAWPEAPDLHTVLIDLDPEAVEVAGKRVQAAREDVRVEAHRTNVFRLPQQAQEQNPLADADFIVCLGFCDYLDDEDLREMLRLFATSLRPGGTMLVGNFSPACRARPYMEWVGNWYLNYREKDDLRRLAERAEFHEPTITPLVSATQLMLQASRG